MQQTDILRTLVLSASVAVVLAAAGLSASAQTMTTTTSTATTSPASSSSAGDLMTRSGAPKGGATPQMIQEACQRQRARTAKFLRSGVPEQFGSEEPFTFNPKAPCS